MKQWLKKRKGRGFTLVELLIVIVIIGILAGSLLLVMGSGTDKANATKVVSDLRTLKAASLMYYADTPANDWPPDDFSDLTTYLDRTPSSTLGSYDIYVSGDLFYVTFEPASTTAGYITQLESMKKEVGLESGINGDKYGMKVSGTN